MITVRRCTEGEPAAFRERLFELIDTHPETTLQRTRDEAFKDICESTEGLPQWYELTERLDGCGRLVSFVILAEDHDAHVGRCLSVQWRINFSDAPQGTTLRMQRMIISLAKYHNFRMIAYTKRLSMGRFEVIYKSL